MVLMLDLGRPDRLIVAVTHYNFTSIFAWNVFLYSRHVRDRRGLPVDDDRAPHEPLRPSRRASRRFVWRFVLTTGTGSIFGFLVARQAYQSALLAPMFIVLSFAWGLAVFLIVQSAMYAWNGRRAGRRGAAPPGAPAGRLRRRGALFGGGVPPDQPVLRAPGRVRGLHPARRRRLSRCCSGSATCCSAGCCRWCCCSTRAWPAPRGTLAASLLVVLGAFALAVRLHHRRAGLPAGDLPRLRRCAAASSTARSRTTRRACPSGCSAWAASARPSC